MNEYLKDLLWSNPSADILYELGLNLVRMVIVIAIIGIVYYFV